MIDPIKNIDPVIVIPVRMGSSRLPGKPLAFLNDKETMLDLCSNAAIDALGDRKVFISTPDIEIEEYCRDKGLKCVRTSSHHDRATSRVAETLSIMRGQCNVYPSHVIMVQGDEPTVQAKHIQLVAEGLSSGLDYVNLLATPSCVNDIKSPHNVKAIINANKRVIYFSRFPIPFSRQSVDLFNSSLFIQTGVIGFSVAGLEIFERLTVPQIETLESIDLNRLIYNELEIGAVISNEMLYSVDTPDDLRIVRDFISRDLY